LINRFLSRAAAIAAALTFSVACASRRADVSTDPSNAVNQHTSNAENQHTSNAQQQASARAGKLYIVNQAGATISIVDQQKLAVDTVLDLRTMGFTANAKPHHVVVEDDGSFWYVSLIGDGRVVKFDRANKVVGEVRMETPGLLTLDPVHDSLYVGRSMTAVNPPKSLGVIARRNFKLVEEQEVLIARPHAISVTRDGKWVHTASLAENRIASVETATGRVTLTTIPGNPRSLVQFAISPDGKSMVSGGELSNTILLFDLTKPPPLMPSKEVMVEGKPWEARFSPDGRSVYVTLLVKNALAEIDVSSGTVKRVIAERLAQPYSMIVRADGKYAFIANQNTGAVQPGQSGHEMHGMAGHNATDGWLSIIDLSTGKLASTLMLGTGPTGMGAARAR
jgi:DNA-binding beta-propeller fold protein YncE